MSEVADIQIKAEYAALIYPFCSTVKTRYNLNGFFVTPHPDQGVYIVATDGHTLGCFHDVDGSAQIPGIISLSKTTLLECKVIKKEKVPRQLIVRGHMASVYKERNDTLGESGTLVAAQGKAVIDGDFVDWEKVIPKAFDATAQAAFSGKYLARFAKVRSSSSELGDSVKIYCTNDHDPALVLQTRRDFFGVIMPMRSWHEMPDWFSFTKEESATTTA